MNHTLSCIITADLMFYDYMYSRFTRKKLAQFKCGAQCLQIFKYTHCCPSTTYRTYASSSKDCFNIC